MLTFDEGDLVLITVSCIFEILRHLGQVDFFFMIKIKYPIKQSAREFVVFKFKQFIKLGRSQAKRVRSRCAREGS